MTLGELISLVCIRLILSILLFSLPFQGTNHHNPKHHLRRLLTNTRHYPLREQCCCGKANFCKGTSEISHLQSVSNLIRSPGLQLLHHTGGPIVHYLHHGGRVAFHGKKAKVLQANGEEQNRRHWV